MTFIATALIINGAVYIRSILEQTNKTLGKPDKVGIIIKSVAKLIYNYYHGLASAAAAAQDSYPATVSLVVVSWGSIMNWSPNTAARSSSNMNTGAFYPRALFSCVMFSCQSLLRTVIITFMKFLAGHPNIAKSKLPSSCPLSLHAIFATPKMLFVNVV